VRIERIDRTRSIAIERDRSFDRSDRIASIASIASIARDDD